MSLSSTHNVVIAGAGQAALSTASELRRLGFSGTLAMIGDEKLAPYQRPPLSKGFLLGNLDEEDLLLRPKAYYQQFDIDLVTDASVVTLDRSRSVVNASDGRVFSYDALVLALGAQPRLLPDSVTGGLRGVCSIRGAADAVRLRTALVPGRFLVVVGGGYLGLEVAAAAAKRGLHVTVVEAAERILQRVACAQTSEVIRSIHRQHGVTVIEGVGVESMSGESAVREVRLSNGEVLPADVVVVAIGVAPSVAIAESAGLHVENGIAVDSSMRTSDPMIWSVGDCASISVGDRRLRIESVGNAIETGVVAAGSIMGGDPQYAAVPWFWSDQYETRLKIAGHNDGYDSVIVRSVGVGLSHWYFRSGELLAVDTIDDARTYGVARRLLERKITPDPAFIADVSNDLGDLVRG